MALKLQEIPKVILTPTLESGGDLPDATTYYFIGFFAHGVGYYGAAKGEASDQVSITTTAANQRIRIDMSFVYNTVTYSGPTAWDDFLALFPDSQPGNTTHRWSWLLKWDYYSMLDGGSVPYKWCNLNDPAISSEFQYSTGHPKWNASYAGGGFRNYYGYLTTSNLITDTNGYFNHSQLAWRYDQFPVLTPFNMDKSDLVIIAEDDATVYDVEDLVNLLEAADSSLQDRFSLSVGNGYSATNAFNLTIKGATMGPGQMSFERLSIVTVSCTQNHCLNITYRNCYIGDNSLTPNFWINPYGTFIDTQWNHTGNAFILDSITLADGFAPWSRSGVTHYGEIVGFFSNGNISHQWRYYKPTMPITNSTFKNTYINATANSVTHDYTGVNAIIWTNVKILDPAVDQYDILCTYSYIGPGETGYDEIKAYGLEVDRPDGKLRARFTSMTNGDGADCIIKVYQEFDITVVDPNGDVIVGADVTITDKDGTQYSDTTDIDGHVSIFALTYSVQWDATDPDGYGNDSRTTDYNTFTLVIDDGTHQAYVERQLNVTGTISKSIALIAADEEGLDGGLTNAYEVQSVRHLFLNEAIPKVGDAAGLQPSATDGYLYVALFTQSPGEAGSIAYEATYSGYARAAVPRGSAGWVELNGQIYNFGQINFPEVVANPNTVTYFAVMKEATGSDMMAYCQLTEQKTFNPTDQPQFGPMALGFKIG